VRVTDAEAGAIKVTPVPCAPFQVLSLHTLIDISFLSLR
jgi:hypothetical protein